MRNGVLAEGTAFTVSHATFCSVKVPAIQTKGVIITASSLNWGYIDRLHRTCCLPRGVILTLIALM